MVIYIIIHISVFIKGNSSETTCESQFFNLKMSCGKVL